MKNFYYRIGAAVSTVRFMMNNSVAAKETNTVAKTENGDLFLLMSVLCCIFLLGILILLIFRLRDEKQQSAINNMTDAETGMGNQLYFENMFNNTISNFSRKMYHIAYIIIDNSYLDAYHSNVTLNDAVKYTASVINDNIRENEFAARVTETGFVVAFQDGKSEGSGKRIESVISKLNDYVSLDEKYKKPVFHAAVYNLDTYDTNCLSLIFNLRRCCGKTIETGEQLVFCDTRLMNKAAADKKQMEIFENAFKNQEFKPYLQFIVDKETKKIVSAETLSRWEHPEKGTLLPGKYLGAIEDAGLISKFDFYMFDQVCRLLERWNISGHCDVSVSCNFTRLTLSGDDFINEIMPIVEKYNFDRSKLIIEITEDAMELDRETALKNVIACKNLGFCVTLDDLGSGYTALSNLCDYPIDVVKIDRDILLKAENKRGKELFAGIIALAHNLNLKVVSEGVETTEQNEFVEMSQSDYIQGWYYFHAVSAKEAEEILNENVTV